MTKCPGQVTAPTPAAQTSSACVRATLVWSTYAPLPLSTVAFSAQGARDWGLATSFAAMRGVHGPAFAGGWRSFSDSVASLISYSPSLPPVRRPQRRVPAAAEFATAYPSDRSSIHAPSTVARISRCAGHTRIQSRGHVRVQRANSSASSSLPFFPPELLLARHSKSPAC